MRREIAKDQALDDEAAQAAHRDWTAEAEPRFKPRFFALQKKLALHRLCDELDLSYGQFVRKARNQVRLYHPAATAVQAECDGLVADFYRVRGAQAAQCQWADSDRARREETFREMVAERGRDRASLDAIVDGLLDRRRAIARQAGCADFREYRFRQLNRFDYGPEHCLRMCEAVEKAAMPLLGRLDGRRARRLGVEALRPWDVEAEAAGLEPLVPFETFGDVLPRVRRVLEKLHAPFAADLDFLLERQLLDLEPRPQKSAFVGYQQFLRPEGLPFIFANIRPAPSALNNLFHELGHASHSLSFRRLPLAWNRDVPLEFGETAANAFQLICGGLLQGVPQFTCTRCNCQLPPPTATPPCPPAKLQC